MRVLFAIAISLIDWWSTTRVPLLTTSAQCTLHCWAMGSMWPVDNEEHMRPYIRVPVCGGCERNSITWNLSKPDLFGFASSLHSRHTSKSNIYLNILHATCLQQYHEYYYYLLAVESKACNICSRKRINVRSDWTVDSVLCIYKLIHINTTSTSWFFVHFCPFVSIAIVRIFSLVAYDESSIVPIVPIQPLS